MDCPRGHGQLHAETHSGIDVDACAVCGGEWLDHDELQAIEATTVTDSFVLSGMIEYQPHDSELRCPVCQGSMYGFDYRANPLQLDACGQGHGYWLDGSEESRVRELIRQRARDLHRAATAEGSFGSFLNHLRGQMGGRGRSR
jgi:Zn-finger nucleic acid-binding protein